MNLTLRAAAPGDWPAIAALLSAADLPLQGAADHLDHFVVAVHDDGRIVGVGGLEHHAAAALLRSIAVEASGRGSGLGTAIVTRLLGDAEARGVDDVVLLTTTAADFFPRFGFTETTRAAIPPALHASEEFRGACPASATVMHLDLRRVSGT